MNRREYQDRIDYCKRELDLLLARPTDCTTCALFNDAERACRRFGQVPADFVARGCDEWDFDDIPF